MLNIMDEPFNGMPHSELYRAQVFPELFPHEADMRIEQWSEDDRAMYVGGEFTIGYETKEAA